MSPALAIANLGAEEPRRQSSAAARVLAPLAALFRSHVERGEPVFAWLPRDACCVAWLNTEDAERRARALDRPLFGAPVAVTQVCHDKAFAQRFAREAGLEPAPLRGRVECFSPGELGDAARSSARIRAALKASSGPGGLTLKPRLGTSGRGRIALAGDADLVRIPPALERLQRAGGAVLEPWLERALDLSVWAYVAPDGAVSLLGSAELRVGAHGGYRGHRGWIDVRGDVWAGVHQEVEMREAALALAAAAARRGYTGPCGIDGFVFHAGGRTWLRPIVELNARFTTGILVLAWLRERLSWLAERMPLERCKRLAFEFELRPPGSRRAAAPPGVLEVPFPDAERAPGVPAADAFDVAPRLCVAEHFSELRAR